jgi:hypothetical protein
MTARHWPLESDRIITSPFGPRAGGHHAGVDFGFPSGSAGRTVYAIDDGTVIYHGAAQGYGGPDPHGWLVIDCPGPNAVWEFGHVTRLPHIRTGVKVTAGQPIATITGDRRFNANTAPHLHLSLMFAGYRPHRKVDPMPYLIGARNPKEQAAVTTVSSTRPDFNEYPRWSRNNEDRRGTKVDLFLLHTEEGGPVKDGADRLARWLGGPVGVSYHYTISQDPVDKGVTVVDVVDTDRASWSALSANRRSINLVFAGSRAAWTRAQWLANSRAIDVAAYLAAQDCAKYNIPRRVIKPPYGPPGGVSDHRYVTRYLKDGTHTDVGGPMGPPWTGFPWDVFEASFLKYANPTPVLPPPPEPPPAPVVTPPPAPEAPEYQTWSDRRLLEEIWLRVSQ